MGAIIKNYDGLKKKVYYSKGKIIHNTKGPAVLIYAENPYRLVRKEYRVNGILHRTNGPAIVEYDRNGNISKKVYYYKGILHRDGGPSIVDIKNHKFVYFIKGSNYTRDEYNKKMLKFKLDNL